MKSRTMIRFGAVGILSALSIMAAQALSESSSSLSTDPSSYIQTGAGFTGYRPSSSGLYQPEPGVQSEGPYSMYNPNDPREDKYGENKYGKVHGYDRPYSSSYNNSRYNGNNNGQYNQYKLNGYNNGTESRNNRYNSPRAMQ